MAETKAHPAHDFRESDWLDTALARAAGAAPVSGNSIRLLKDGPENFPAWLEAIASARQYVYFEMYIFKNDKIGQQFADALCARAREGVRVRVLYDWLGCFGTSSRLWRRLREAGVHVRCFNPFDWSSPLGWVHRDHRKTVSVDGRVAFVSGLCVGDAWAGDPEKGIAPWHDTGEYNMGTRRASDAVTRFQRDRLSSRRGAEAGNRAVSRRRASLALAQEVHGRPPVLPTRPPHRCQHRLRSVAAVALTATIALSAAVACSSKAATPGAKPDKLIVDTFGEFGYDDLIVAAILVVMMISTTYMTQRQMIKKKLQKHKAAEAEEAEA